MGKLNNSAYIAQIMKLHNLDFKKSLGQNFLIDANITAKIIEKTGILPTDGIIEIGAGIGSLTEELLAKANRVVAVEVDDRLWPILEANFGDNDKFHLVKADVLKLDLAELIAKQFSDKQRILVVANLPYYITTPIIMKLLEERLPLASITVMVQKEVAERITAEPNNKAYGALTVSARFYAEPELLFVVGKGCFMPTPAVDSAVIKLTIKENELVLKSDSLFFQTLKAAFNQRRKTLLNALSHNLNLEKKVLKSALLAAEINPQARAENLSSQQFADLANLIWRLKNE